MPTARTIESGTRWRGLDALLLVALSTLWGASYVFIRIGVATIPPLTLIAARTLVAGVLLAAWVAISGTGIPRDPAIWRRFGVQSLLNSVVPFTLIAWAEQSVEAGLATILNSTSPLFTYLATWFVSRHGPLPLRKLFGVVTGFAGVCLVIGPGALARAGDQVLAQLAIVAATLCYSGAALYGRAFQDLDPAIPAAGSMILGAAVLVPLSLAIDQPWTLNPSVSSLAALLALSIGSTALAFVIYFRLLQTMGPVATTAQAYLRVPMGVALSVGFLDESLTPTVSAGLVGVVAGVVAMTLPPGPRRAARMPDR